MKLAEKQQTERLKQNELKWSKKLMDAGWTVFPSVILERQQALGLDATDVNIMLHLARHWWYADNLPHPSKRTIAACIGVDVTTVRRRIAKMEAAGFIKRVYRWSPQTGRQETNLYSLQGLIDLAAPFADEALDEKKRHQEEKAARQSRKRPKFKVVPGVKVADLVK